MLKAFARLGLVEVRDDKQNAAARIALQPVERVFAASHHVVRKAGKIRLFHAFAVRISDRRRDGVDGLVGCVFDVNPNSGEVCNDTQPFALLTIRSDRKKCWSGPALAFLPQGGL